MDTQPNVVLVHTDDTGRYIGPYGHDVETPNLQRHAEAGVLFRNAFSAAPTCSPSRSALFTGASPHSNGMFGLAHRGFAMDDYDRHLAGFLSAGGYESALAGQQHEVDGDAVDRDGTEADVLGYDRALEGDPDDVDDLAIDPTETNNLVDNPDYRDVRRNLRRRLTDWMERTDDPLLDGPVSKPAGAVADPQDALDPDEGEYEPPDAR